MNDEQVQQKYTELQLLSAQLKQIQQQIEVFSQQTTELNTLLESMEEVEKTKKDTEILAPLGSGIFVKAKLEDPKSVIMAVGGKTTVTKDTASAKEVVQNQVNEINKVMENMKAEFEKGAVRIQHLQLELQSMLAKKEENK